MKLSLLLLALFTLAMRDVRAQSAEADGRGESIAVAELSVLMPRIEDYTSMWWAEGFPGSVPNAAWLRCIQTGYYAMVLDTATLQISRFGPVPSGTSYLSCGQHDTPAWQTLAPAELELNLLVNGKRYRGTAGGRWSQFTGPRLIESGRFLQRADVTDLVFTSPDGDRLKAEARFETAAWPDWLGLILAVRPGLPPIKAGEDSFGTIGGADGRASTSQLSEPWDGATMEIILRTERGQLKQCKQMSADEPWSATEWREVFLALNPNSFQPAPAKSQVTVQATELSSGAAPAVEYDAARGWYRVDLNGITPIVPPGEQDRRNDAIERIKLVLSNPGEREQVARLLFAKNAGGIRQGIGSPITGVSAILRDAEGHPTGIPVQLSKNWHNRREGGVYAGLWFHGLSQVRLPPRARVELELTLAYGHWGGVPAASHAQLSLIGWGTNQRWDESALGAWGESICYEPDQIQGQCSVLDVRPAMVLSMDGAKQWSWTNNVGGGDFFRLFDGKGDRLPHASMRAAYQRQGPCFTEVTYSGRLGEGIRHSETVSLTRTDDLVRGTYQLRMDVLHATEFSRFVIFQIGADTYSYTREGRMAWGDESGLMKEWDARWGGNTYRTTPIQCTGRIPWFSLHEAVPREKNGAQGAWANRGIVVRAWKARLGGKDASPWIAERGISARGEDSSTLDIVPPPGVTRLEPGDFVEATIEHIVMPQYARDYYGPNEPLRDALSKFENTWRMIHREAIENDRHVETSGGTLERLYPDVRVRATDNRAQFTITGGLGYVPITITDLTSSREHTLSVDGHQVDQSVHGNDFWQTDYDPASRRWCQTYNIRITDGKPHVIRFTPVQ